jgi:hypothetical protein
MKTTLASLAALFLLHAPSLWACVGCREPGVGGAEEPRTIAAGIALSWGVLSMLAIVGLLVGGMTIYIVNTCRRLDSERRIP